VLNQECANTKAHFNSRILPTEFTRISVDAEGNNYLTYKNVNTWIPKAQLEPVLASYEGIEFPTVNPGVLAGFALTRGGSVKPRDLNKIRVLFDQTSFHIPSEFRDFAQSIRHQHPVAHRNFLIREWLNYWSGGFISGGQLTKVTERLKKKKA